MVCLLSAWYACGLLLLCLYIFWLSSSLLLFYSLFDTVILSQQGSLLFATRVYLFQHDTKKKIHVTAN